MLDTIAAQWMSAGGSTDAAEPRDILLWLPDDLVASECIDGWALNPRWPEPADEDSRSHMDKNDYTAADLAQAFARLRTTIFVARNWSMAA